MTKEQVYLGEIESQLDFAKKSYKAFLEAYNKREVVETFMHIHHFLIHISMIDKILDTSNNAFRASIIGNLLKNFDLKPFRRIRNHLEHLDERLDNWIKNYDGKPFYDMNFVTGTKNFPQKTFLRALDGMTLKFHGEDFDLNKAFSKINNLETEIEKIQSQIKK